MLLNLAPLETQRETAARPYSATCTPRGRPSHLLWAPIRLGSRGGSFSARCERCGEASRVACAPRALSRLSCYQQAGRTDETSAKSKDEADSGLMTAGGCTGDHKATLGLQRGVSGALFAVPARNGGAQLPGRLVESH